MNSAHERFRSLVKSLPFAMQIRTAPQKVSARRHRKVLQSLGAFVPYSAGSAKMLSSSALLAAEQTLPLLAKLAREMDLEPMPIVDADELCSSPEQRRAAAELKSAFEAHGSDKSDFHNYELVYGAVLGEPGSIGSLLEVGLGSGDRNIVSNMGRGARPGASLRAFRDYLPTARVYGADVDREVLFEEDRISTFHVDQTDLRSVRQLASSLPAKLDVVIDDGLHCPNANLSILLLAVESLKPGGWVIIEDISEEALPVWEVITALISDRFTCHMVQARNGLVFVAQQR